MSAGEVYDRWVRAALNAELGDTGLVHIRTRAIPWNAKRWAYHYRTMVTPTVTSDDVAEMLEVALGRLSSTHPDDVAEIGRQAGDYEQNLRPRAWVVWK